MSLVSMPDEILAAVFRTLSADALAKSACVCRRLHSLAVESLYRNIVFQAPPNLSEQSASDRNTFKFYSLLRILAAKPCLTSHVRSLSLQAWHVTGFFSSPPIIPQKPLEFPMLTSLDLEYGSMTPKNLNELLQRTPRLRRLYCEFKSNFEAEGPFNHCFDLESLGHALKLVSNTIEDLAIAMSSSYMQGSPYPWKSSQGLFKLKGRLGSVLRKCPQLKSLTTQMSILLGVPHNTKIGLLDVLPLTLSQLRFVDDRPSLRLGGWFDRILVDKLFDYLRDGAIDAGLKHLFVESRAKQADLCEEAQAGILCLCYYEVDWKKLKRLVSANGYDYLYHRNIVSINSQKDPCEHLIRGI